jgi:cytochrome c5
MIFVHAKSINAATWFSSVRSQLCISFGARAASSSGRQTACKRIARAFFGLSAPPDPAAVERGQQLYVTNCGFCHGTNANGGNSGPDLCWSTSTISAFL